MTKEPKNNPDQLPSQATAPTRQSHALAGDETGEGVVAPQDGEATASPGMEPAPSSVQANGLSWIGKAMVIAMRIVVGGVFVFSGFVKAVDPWGIYYKFNEYLQVLGWDSLMGLTVFGAFALSACEFVLGVLLVTGSCRRMAPLGAVLFMLFMTPLTLWLAVTDAVPDCGCFGDYLILGNWATFGKNLTLLAGSVYLLLLNRRVVSVYGPAVQWMVIMLSFAFPLLISFTGYFTQPVLDFRPYKVGSRLVSQAPSMADGDYVFIYEKDGVQQEFPIDSVPDDDSGWNYVNRRSVKPQATTAGQGLTLAAWDGDDDVSDLLLAHDQLLLILIPDVEKVSVAYTFRINELQTYADQHGVSVAALTSATDAQIGEWNDIAMAHYPVYKADDSDIKMIARGNPSVVYVHDGVIEWKRTLVSIDPELIHDGEKSVAQFSDDFHPRDILDTCLWAYLFAMLAVLIVNRTHLVFMPRKK